MPLVSDTFQKKKLDKYNINIKTKYIVDNKILERNTDNSINNDISKGIRCKKEYYINKELKHIETNFDSRIEYTFISSREEEADYKCPNCGMIGKVRDFIDGCPYCNTNYNIEYSNKDLGSKYHYDRVLKNNTYRIITFIIDFIISLILSFIFIKMTSRTFNNIDIIKVFIYGSILCLILYYFFYMVDAYFVLGAIKKYKDKQNEKQKLFWEKTGIDKETFFNNFNYEIRKYYYSKDNVIDYDILDYEEFKDYKKDNTLYVDVKVFIRIVYYDNNKIYSKDSDYVYTMVKYDKGTIEIKGGINYIKCHNCGASIDVNSGKCEYCDTKIKYFQEWMLKENIDK